MNNTPTDELRYNATQLARTRTARQVLTVSAAVPVVAAVFGPALDATLWFYVSLLGVAAVCILGAIAFSQQFQKHERFLATALHLTPAQVRDYILGTTR